MAVCWPTRVLRSAVHAAPPPLPYPCVKPPPPSLAPCLSIFATGGVLGLSDSTTGRGAGTSLLRLAAAYQQGACMGGGVLGHIAHQLLEMRLGCMGGGVLGRIAHQLLEMRLG